MRFEFDTTAISRQDILILTAIASALGGSPIDRAPQATVGHNGASGTPAHPSPSEATGTHQATEASTDQGEDASAPVNAKSPRIRRTKAQIEADNLAAEKAFADKQIPIQLTQTQQDAMDDTAGILTTEQKSAIQGAVDGTGDAAVTLTAAQVQQIVDLDTLRTALQTYTGKHDLAAGIALLGTFECKRISDVLNIPADKQQAFLLACNV